MQIQNLASILTSEAAFQSTSKISEFRFQWNDAIFLGHSTIFPPLIFNFLVYVVVVNWNQCKGSEKALHYDW